MARASRPRCWSIRTGGNDVRLLRQDRSDHRSVDGIGEGFALGIAGAGADLILTPRSADLLDLTLQLGCEWADRGVRVNSVSPGFIVTEMVRPALEGMGMDKWIASRTPMRRIGELDEIVDPVLFLASDAASYITGHDLNVDGGTNAANGYYQIPPIHQEWNSDTAPRVGGGYAGVVPRPDWYQALQAGIPGFHFLPE